MMAVVLHEHAVHTQTTATPSDVLERKGEKVTCYAVITTFFSRGITAVVSHILAAAAAVGEGQFVLGTLQQPGPSSDSTTPTLDIPNSAILLEAERFTQSTEQPYSLGMSHHGFQNYCARACGKGTAARLVTCAPLLAGGSLLLNSKSKEKKHKSLLLCASGNFFYRSTRLWLSHKSRHCTSAGPRLGTSSRPQSFE
jgi:hypothetical protein